MAKTAKKFYTPHEGYLQNGIYLIVFVVLALILWPLAPSPNKNAVGLLLPNGTATYQAISPGQVQVLATPPKGAHLIGEINTKIHYNSTSDASDDHNLQKCLSLAKTLAAQYGANFVVVNIIGRTVDRGPLDGFVVYAGAYHD
jgi:hypothetical protein